MKFEALRPAKLIYLICVTSLMKTPHASSGILEITINHLPASNEFHQKNWKTTPCLITKTVYLPYYIVKFKIKCLPASLLSIPFSDTDLMFQFCLPKVQYSCEIRNSPYRFFDMVCSDRLLFNIRFLIFRSIYNVQCMTHLHYWQNVSSTQNVTPRHVFWSFFSVYSQRVQ